MGFYIETPGHRGKAIQILALSPEAQHIPGPPVTVEDAPEGMTVVCVVQNGPFDAAAIVYDDRELTDFLPTPEDPRPRDWLLVPTAWVVEQNPSVSGMLA